ncbi:hypothetical protein SAMN05216262_101173 [Colwellia chukchiensis]|uniref:Signal transduction histidine kinase n=2 Tax=Colwellia chukchiensis TaxID=641665 RepID=A0A1H7GE04_9GAMM|nr:hypothetical protein SAMN05216262_101173 [Colwellia chukchiensis]
MPFVVKSATHLKKHLQVLANLFATNVSQNTNSWRSLVPCLLLMASWCSAVVNASELNGRYIHSGSIIQDTKGFIWLASTNGLIRHDSENNIVFNNKNKDWPLPFNWINDISLLANDQLLLATETHRLWLFDTNSGKATELPADIHHNSVYQVTAHQGNYFLNVHYKLYQVDPRSSTTQVIANNVNINFLEHTQQYLYIGTDDGVFRVVGKTLEQIESGPISAMTAAADTLLIAKGEKLISLADKGRKQTTQLSATISALAHSQDKSSLLAIDVNGVISQFKLSNLAKVAHNYPNIKPARVEKLYQDNTGVLWVLSNHGIEKVMPSIATNIEKIFDVDINAMALAVHQEQLVIGSYGSGLHTLVEQSRLLPNNINDALTTKAKFITDLYSYQGNIYITTFDGLWRFDTEQQTLTRVPFHNNNLLLLAMRYQDHALYLATNANGLIKYDLRQKRIAYHIEAALLRSGEVLDILPLADNKLWVATSVGIDIVDADTNKVTHIKRFAESKVISLLAYQGKIFATTNGDGLFVFNLQGELLSHLAKNVVFGYMSFINDEIWISGRPGLYRLNPENYQLNMVANSEQYSFSKKQVLLNNKIYASHYGGILAVPLTNENTLNAKVYISKTIASGKAELLSRSINIESPNDIVTFELASLDFRAGQKKQFKYQINGGDWYDINGQQLTLTGLSSGEYHIEIMGTNSLGQWSNSRTYADINVAYPWYWHPHSRIIYAVLLTAIILLTAWLLYLRSRSISHIHRLLEEEINTNSQSTALIRRKLIKALASITSVEQATEKSNNRAIAQGETQRQNIKALLTECLDELASKNSHHEPSSLSGSSLSVALPYLVDHFHAQYHVLISLQLDIDDNQVDYAIQSAIYRIIFQAILAAVTNGNGGVFAIQIKQNNDKIWLKITDNEQSFSQFSSKINFDMAMYYIRQVANKFNATFHTYDNQEHGSEIIISIPLLKVSAHSYSQ